MQVKGASKCLRRFNKEEQLWQPGSHETVCEGIRRQKNGQIRRKGTLLLGV